MQNIYFIGMDVSKKKLDICVLSKSKVVKEMQVSNHQAAITAVLNEIKEDFDMTDEDFIICAEHTGHYTYPLSCACAAMGCTPWLENPTQIKYSCGMTRGKNDRVDARRIAEYAIRFADRLRASMRPTKELERLKQLEAERTLYLTDIAKYKAQLSNQKKSSKNCIPSSQSPSVRPHPRTARNKKHQRYNLLKWLYYELRLHKFISPQCNLNLDYQSHNQKIYYLCGMQQSIITRLRSRTTSLWSYVTTEVWTDTRRKWWVTVVKTLNLSARSFMNRDIQSQACAMTYRTLLAIVPALALLFAIGRGFGIQNVLQKELFDIFPSQRTAISYALNFVDSYLSQASEGLFVGVGVAFLLWTLISLISNIEGAFNLVWGLKEGRSFWRKITDYTAMLLILPVIMLCASGITLLLSSTLRALLDFELLTPLVSVILEVSSWLLTWLFFTAAYILIPNVKVKFKNAFVAGAIAGTGFLIVQWVFVTGQMYVARYNAIYGSFSFLPLMLLWLQLTWMITLAGAVVCYSSQNIFSFSLDNEVSQISDSYRSQVTMAVAAIIVQRFMAGNGATTADHLIQRYNLPPRLVSGITDKLLRAEIIATVLIDEKKELHGYAPAIDPGTITVATIAHRLNGSGRQGFIPDFNDNFPGVATTYRRLGDAFASVASETRLADIKIAHN